MRILFIGGNGNISWHCANKAQQCGHAVWILNRGNLSPLRRPCHSNVTHLYADMRDPTSVKNSLDGLTFDVVADFVCYTPEHACTDIEIFRNRTKQFIFVSSTANYKRPCTFYPITEDAVMSSPDWYYARNKIDCENVFMQSHKEDGFPVTIVRPSHTYDTIIPDAVGNGDWTVAKRMLEGKPIIIHGDGSSLWTVTHSEDFANAFVQLFNNPETIGEAFHITSDEWLTWRDISNLVASALNAPAPRLICVPSEKIAAFNSRLGKGLLGHKTWSDIYDNSKIKYIAKGWTANIPFAQGIKRTVEWLQEDKSRQSVNTELDSFFDSLCEREAL